MNGAEYEFNENWMKNSGSGNDGSPEGCCCLILIGIAAFFILGFIGMIFF